MKEKRKGFKNRKLHMNRRKEKNHLSQIWAALSSGIGRLASNTVKINGNPLENPYFGLRDQNVSKQMNSIGGLNYSTRQKTQDITDFPAAQRKHNTFYQKYTLISSKIVIFFLIDIRTPWAS